MWDEIRLMCAQCNSKYLLVTHNRQKYGPNHMTVTTPSLESVISLLFLLAESERGREKERQFYLREAERIMEKRRRK